MRAESSVDLPRGTDFIKQNVGKFKFKVALENNGDFGGKQLRGD